jgi:hypothetical protein
MKRPAPPPHHPWVVAVPVVVLLLLGSVLHRLFIFGFVTFRRGDEALFFIRAGPLTLLEALTALCVAVAAYCALWIVFSVREAVRLGRRAVPSPPLARALALLVPLGFSLYGAVGLGRTPSAEEYLAGVEADMRRGEVYRYWTAVRFGVPGVEKLCRKLRDDEDSYLSFYGAAGAYHRGDRGDKTRRILHERIEALRETLRREEFSRDVLRKYECAALLVRESTPAPMGFYGFDLGLGHDARSSFWLWWEEAEPSFRTP